MVTYSVSLFIGATYSNVFMLLEMYLYYCHTQRNLNVFLLRCKINTGLVDCMHTSHAMWPLRKTPIWFPSLWQGPELLVVHLSNSKVIFRGFTVWRFARSGEGGGRIRRFRHPVSQSRVHVHRDGGPTILNIACCLNDMVCIVMTPWAPVGLLGRESH